MVEISKNSEKAATGTGGDSEGDPCTLERWERN